MLQETISDILVFKTNVKTQDERHKVASLLDSLTGVRNWSIDQDDIDKVLRIEKQHMEASEIITVMRAAGFECEELPD